MSTQPGIPGLFEERVDMGVGPTGERRRPKVWKRVRNVSKALYAELRDDDTLARRESEFLLALAAYTNRFGLAPTLRELTRWAYLDGRIATDDPNIFRPRATALTVGIPTEAGLVGGGVCEYLPKRMCAISQRAAAPIRIREAGSQETR